MYLFGRKFVHRTDHKALIFLSNTEDINSRLLRRVLKLQEFYLEREFIKFELNGPDGLSRHMDDKILNSLTMKTRFTNDEKLIKIEEAHITTGHGVLMNMKNILSRADLLLRGIDRDIM